MFNSLIVVHLVELSFRLKLEQKGILYNYVVDVSDGKWKVLSGILVEGERRLTSDIGYLIKIV